MSGDASGPEIVIAAYRAKPGRAAMLEELLAGHVPLLRRLGLATTRPPMLMRAADGHYVEIFEWATPDAAAKAHDLPDVAAYWDRMAESCDWVTLGDLAESRKTFPHFLPMALRAD